MDEQKRRLPREAPLLRLMVVETYPNLPET